MADLKVKYKDGDDNLHIDGDTLDSTDILLASGKVMIGQDDGQGAAKDIAGDVTIDKTGASAIGAKKVTTSKIALAHGSMLRGAATGDAEELTKGAGNQFLSMDPAGANPNWYNVGGDVSQTGGTFTVQNLGSNVTAQASGGTPETGVTAQEFGDAYNHVTVLSFSGLSVPGPSGGGAAALGKLLYTFPAGAHVHEVTAMGVALQGGGTVDADTPDVGIGSVIGSTAVATLDLAPAGAEDYLTGQTAADCSGTTTNAGPLAATTTGYGTGISLNGPAGVKTVHLNYADSWAGADTLSASGGVVLKWTTLPVGP